MAGGHDSHDHDTGGTRRFVGTVPHRANEFGVPLRTTEEREAARTDMAMWSTVPVFLAAITVMGTWSASAGLVLMIGSFTALAVYFAVTGPR